MVEVIWSNPDIKSCPWCFFYEPCTRCYRAGKDGVAHLRDHLLKYHHKNLAAVFANGNGGASVNDTAWRMAKAARPPTKKPWLKPEVRFDRPVWRVHPYREPAPTAAGGAVELSEEVPAPDGPATPTAPPAAPLRSFEMFSGIGAARYAAESLGWVSVGFCEISKDSVREYRANFDTSGDFFWPNARTLPTEDMPDLDVLIAGFPCQAFSHQGSRRGFEDTRGTLFREVARVVRDKRPAAFILENVGGLLTHNGGDTFATILGVLGRTINGQAGLEEWEGCVGYDVSWKLVNSKDFGVAQNRPRVYIIGFRPGAQARPFSWPATNGYPHPVLRDILEPDDKVDPKLFVDEEWFRSHYAFERGAPGTRGEGAANGIRTVARWANDRTAPAEGVLEVDPLDTQKSARAVDAAGISPAIDTKADASIIVVGRRREFNSTVAVHEDGVSPTLNTESGWPGPGILVVARKKNYQSFVAVSEEGLHPTVTTWTAQTDTEGSIVYERKRWLTARECARLQGFPETHKILPPRRDACFRFGNAMTVPVMRALEERVQEALGRGGLTPRP